MDDDDLVNLIIGLIVLVVLLRAFDTHAEPPRGPNGPCADVPQWNYVASDPFASKIPHGASRTIHFEFARTQEEIDRKCRAPKGAHYNGCQYDMSDGSRRIIVGLPVNFNDRKWLCVVGHEVMHAVGGEHE